MKRIISKAVVLLAALFITISTMAQDANSFRQPYELGQKITPNPNFIGDAWLAPLSQHPELNVPMFNVTFSPGCRNNWHTHKGGQILIATAGIGYYQEKDKPAHRLFPGDIVEIAPDVEHWHGAAPDSWFAHIAIECNPQDNHPTWLTPVNNAEYLSATQNAADVYIKENKALTPREQAIISVGAYTGRGDLEHLPQALVQALDAGMTVNEIKEVLIQSYAYCGFPRSLRAIQTFMQLLNERKSQGIDDVIGKEASPIANNGDKYDHGAAILEILSGVNSAHPKLGYGAFAPTIDQFLKEHLFADIFERDLLTYRERELATVSFLAGVGGVEPMAYGHMSICLHLGITPSQLNALLNIVEINLGEASSAPLREVLSTLTK